VLQSGLLYFRIAVLNRLLVGEHHFLPRRSGQSELRAERSAFEDGLTDAEGCAPGLRWLLEEAVQALLSSPPVPVRARLGKKEAFATPIRALAAIMLASASRTSGRRRSSNSEGKPKPRDH